MDAKEYRGAVKEAKRIFAYVKITATRRQAMRVSKVKALELIRQVNGDEIEAAWASDDHTFLLVG